MIWFHRRAYPFIDNWTDRDWLQTTTSFRHPAGTVAWTGTDAASDELFHFQQALQRLLVNESQTEGYYPSYQVFIIKLERTEDRGFLICIEHEDGGHAQFQAAAPDLQRWITELSAILHIYPRMTGQNSIGEPYVSVQHPDHLAPQLDPKMF